MTRVLSAVVLAALVLAVVCFLPPNATLLLAVLASAVAFAEYADLAAAVGARDSHRPERRRRGRGLRGRGRRRIFRSSRCVLLALIVHRRSSTVARGQPGPEVLRDAAASLFPMLYIGIPLGALAAIRLIGGRDATLLLIATIIVSDSAQYYTGTRARPAPAGAGDQPEQDGRRRDRRARRSARPR